jgi:hypothetical protein
MKTITPVSIWHNGNVLSANQFVLYCVDNNLLDSATFYYRVQSDGVPVDEGNLSMQGATYLSMNSSSDSNTYTWNWAASQLNITIIGG